MKSKTINQLLRAFAFAGILLGASALANETIMIINNTDNDIAFQLNYTDTSSTKSSRQNKTIELIVTARQTHGVGMGGDYPLKSINFPIYKKSLLGSNKTTDALYEIPTTLASKNWQFTIAPSTDNNIQVCGAYSDTIDSDSMTLVEETTSKCETYQKQK